MKNPTTNRLWQIDFLRGLAVIGMIIFHLFFILNFFNISTREMYAGGWLILARFVQFTFIGLVGISLALSRSSYKKQFRRGLSVLLLGTLITIVTYIFIPEQFVRFGILHLIGLSIIILAPIAHKRYLSLILGIIAFAAAKPINELLNIKIFSSVDYFEIFPWISVVLFGIFLGNFLYDRTKDRKNPGSPNLTSPFIFLGQHSLLIYMIHIPLILLILIIFNSTQILLLV